MNIKKSIPIMVLGVCVLFIGTFFLINKQKPEEIIFQKTAELSKEYLALRYRTDDVLTNAERYTEFETWDEEVKNIIRDWKKFEEEALKLEELANDMTQENEISLIRKANAYDNKEVQSIIEKAPAGKTVRTLAQHFGVDMKKAQLILNQSQDMATREAWGEAGDAFETLENQAIVIKDGCKVAGYVGGIVITGGAAGLATAGTLTQVGVVVVGADLALEVTEDGAKIALGDGNKVSSFVKDIRVVTEPIATVLTITNVPNNLGTAFGKFEGVMVGLEQFRDSVQEGKVVGIDLQNFKYNPPFQVIRKTQYPGTVTVAEMDKMEVEDWLKDLNKEYKTMNQEEVAEYLNVKYQTGKQDESFVIEEDGKAQEDEKNPDKKDEITNSQNSETAKKGIVSFSEWDDWGDADSRYKTDLIDKFGNPDVTQSASGKQVWVYYDLVFYESGNTCSPTYTFYDTDQTATRRCLSKVNVESYLNNN